MHLTFTIHEKHVSYLGEDNRQGSNPHSGSLKSCFAAIDYLIKMNKPNTIEILWDF